MSAWIVFTTIGGGYVIGSLSPAYFFGRRLKGIDIRTVGRGHAGASNVYLHVNHMAGFITGAFDVAKGAAVVMASRCLLRAPLSIAYLGGFAAVAGHVFPFYLGFRGGRGAAAGAGLLMLSLSWLMLSDPLYFLPELILMAFVVTATLAITRDDYVLSLAVLPLLTYFLLVRYYPRPEAIAAVLIIGYVFTISLIHYVKEEGLSFSRQDNPVFWSSVFDLLLLAFLVLAVQYPSGSPFLIPLALTVVCLYLDAVRLRDEDPRHRPTIKRLAYFLYRIGEGATFSATTLALLSAAVTFFLFRQPLALAAVSFMIAGDVAEKVIDPLYGRTRFLASSWEATLGHFTTCVVIAYILHSYLGLSIGALLAGAVTASVVESLPLHAFSKVVVPVATALAMLVFAV